MLNSAAQRAGTLTDTRDTHVLPATGKLAELQAELTRFKARGSGGRGMDGSQLPRKRALLKRICANVVLGTDVAALLPEMIEWLDIPDLECRKLVSSFTF